ncbi:fic family toxin-antitoxin system, toxin component [Streptomyces phaeolivaceus]|uniref:Fic family toxin-antitoxin system, toxin component n=1 Tax=Streptomyces phaeolivaceus TaxID=2653200 RepID=A0A5P8JXB5_9ACTN|nr:fic family toxin-antitoxin system, toxin component [Streptomyces phaeolivaceus]QFQ95663.1 fic family toxin-antitoxin system, toxin component [Streptomyces phaeolivaceus]
MTPPRPVPLDVTFLLHAAERLDGGPRIDDYGPFYAAVARVNAKALEHDMYGSPYLKAAALLQTLAKLPCLEHSNAAFAWHATEAYLILNTRALDYPPEAAVALVRDAASGTLGVARIARRLRDWSAA